MELIPYGRFAKLRLDRFVRGDRRVARLTDWEFMDALWIGEAVEFTAFLRLANTPDETGSVEVSASALPRRASHAILDAVGLPLRIGMTVEQITTLLGAPVRTTRFVTDRQSYEYSVGRRFPYRVDCTVENHGGLVYVVILRADVLRRIRAV